MLNDVFRSFFRTIGRILAYLVIGGLIAYLLSFVNIANVKAASYVMPSDFEVPTWARFSNCTSKDVCTSHTNTQLYGSLWYSNANLYTTANGSGIGLNIYTLEGFNANNYYTVNVLVEVTDDSEMNYGTPLAITSNDKKVGVGLNETQAYQVAGSATVNSMTNVEVRSYRDESTYITYSTGASILSYTFKANTSGNFVFMTMSTGANFTGEWKLYGYQIIDHGSQAPSTSEIQQALQNNFYDLENSINSNINEMKDKQDETNDILDAGINGESEDTESSSCGIICKLKGIFTGIIELPTKLVSLLIDALKSLIVPDDMDFINDFVESIEEKLGFIAAIPVQIIEFGLDLATASWEEVTSVSLPSISIFGYNFWSAQEIDISEGLAIFQTFRYVTDALCVVICAKGLIKLWENFTGGGSS